MTSVLEYLRQSAERFPEKVALSNGETALSYKSYLSLSQKVGAYVAQKEADCRAVGVWALRSIYTPVLFFGAVWGGCCYVPLDRLARRGNVCRQSRFSGKSTGGRRSSPLSNRGN